jgi:hypothetical protein
MLRAIQTAARTGTGNPDGEERENLKMGNLISRISFRALVPRDAGREFLPTEHMGGAWARISSFQAYAAVRAAADQNQSAGASGSQALRH